MYYLSVASTDSKRATHAILVGDNDTDHQPIPQHRRADLLMSRLSSALQTSMSLDCSSAFLPNQRNKKHTVEVKGIRMGYTLLDHGTGREITSPVGIGGVGSEEPHVVPFSTNDEGELGLVVGSTDGSSSHSELLEFLPTG